MAVSEEEELENIYSKLSSPLKAGIVQQFTVVLEFNVYELYLLYTPSLALFINIQFVHKIQEKQFKVKPFYGHNQY